MTVYNCDILFISTVLTIPRFVRVNGRVAQSVKLAGSISSLWYVWYSLQGRERRSPTTLLWGEQNAVLVRMTELH